MAGCLSPFFVGGRAAKGETVRKIKEVLRLKFEAGLSHELIGAAVGVSKGVVTKYVQRAVAVGLRRDPARLVLPPWRQA